jgi:hypothetical protein
MSDVEHLRELAAWFRGYAERPAPIDSWDSWLRVADAFDADAARLDAAERESRPGMLAIGIYALAIVSMVTAVGVWSFGITGALLGMLLGFAIIVAVTRPWSHP